MESLSSGHGYVALLNSAVKQEFIFRLIYAVFLKGLPHGDEVFGRYIGLDIVNSIEYVSAAGRQSLDIASDVVFDFPGRAVW
jgi:hypothetical protein